MHLVEVGIPFIMTFQMNVTVEIKSEKKVHLGGGQAKPSLYSAKNPVKDHNPDKILPPQYYLFGEGCLVAKGAGVYFQSSTYECGFNKFLKA